MVLTKRQSPTTQRRLSNHYSTRKNDSPSRQLQSDLERALEQLVIHDHEVSKVHAYQRRTYHEELEARDSARTKAHTAAIDAAKAKHEAVREEAEAVLQQYLREQEAERRRKEEEERQRQERNAREKAEREQKVKEEAERKAREEAKRKEAEEARARKVADEKARVEAEERAQKQREATAEKERAERDRVQREQEQKDAASKAQAEKDAASQKQKRDADIAAKAAASKSMTTALPAGSNFYSASSTAESNHKAYLELHRSLKTFRKNFWEQAKQNKALKTAVGDMRRAIRTSVGQLTDDKPGNRKATDRVKTAIQSAMNTVPSPAVPINDFLPSHLRLPGSSSSSSSSSSSQTTIPSLVIYLLSIFSKAIVAAFTAEAAVNPRAAEPIGTLAAQVFSLPELQIPNSSHPSGFTSLISVLICKFHRAAPVLFGISGPENTAAGRQRLGWRTEGETDRKSFVIDQRHHERMTGLGAGYSSIALRNFSKTKLRNPFPPTHFWESLAFIVNTPPAHVTTSHLLLLKSMLDNNAIDRFILFFGSVGVAAVREAIIRFPARLPEQVQKGAACRSITIMADALAEEKHVRFD